MKFRLFLMMFLCVSLLVIQSQVLFSDIAISSANEILFSAEVDVPEYQRYKSGFIAEIDEATGNTSIKQITTYPERIDYLPNSGQIQIQNRFGLFRSNSNLENIAPVELFPSFEGGADIQTGKINGVTPSPDGRYMIHFEAVSPAFGNLILTSFVDSSVTVVSSSVELYLDQIPLEWSPESDFFIYQKGGDLYYFSIDQFENNRLPNENFRSIGKGQIANVRWGQNNELYFLSGTLLYQILAVEFFTRSIYQEFLPIGRIVGKIPFSFDPNFDRFWIAPDNSRILLNKGGRNLYLFPLQTNDYAGTALTIELPYLYLPVNVTIKRVLWPASEILTILVEGVFEGRRESGLYRLDLSDERDIYSFERLDTPDFVDVFFGPDEDTGVLLAEHVVTIYDYKEWEPRQRFQHENLQRLVYINDDEILLAGADIIELVNVSTRARRFIAFSRIDDFGFSSSNGEILVRAGEFIKAYDPLTGRWFDRNNFNVVPPGQVTEDFRVYEENLNTGRYNNIVLARQINSGDGVPRTITLFNRPQRTHEPFPESEEEVIFNPFEHGSRIRRREVSLVFNAINSVIGLNEVLQTLDAYNVEATFFVNGDFIRRHPGAIREIAQSRHEVGSLFHIYFDMSDIRFQINSDFIRNGLIQNEDEYFEATGNELSLFWHAPYYYVSPEIIDATESLSYTYVGRDVDGLDWVSTYDDSGRSRFYFPASQLVERIIEEKKPGSIISMTIGTTDDDRADGGREDYLFHHLDVLINSLLDRGYSIVPVSTLMDHAQ